MKTKCLCPQWREPIDASGQYAVVCVTIVVDDNDVDDDDVAVTFHCQCFN